MRQSFDDLIDDYLRLGLAFDGLEEGFVDAYTGDPALRREVANQPTSQPRELAQRAAQLRSDLTSADAGAERIAFVDAHLAALECSARVFAGDEIGFVDEVSAYFDVDITMGDEATYRQAHSELDALLPGGGSLAERFQRHRDAEVIDPQRLSECVQAFSGALRERVRQRYPLPDHERVEFDVVSDKPWSGFNYYLGNYQSKVAINGDLTMYMSSLPHLIAHEAYPGHHTEHCRKEQRLVGAGHREHSIFLVNTPQCLMAEGLADHALTAIIGEDWPMWAQENYADLGLRFDGQRAQQISRATSSLLRVRQDAALLLHDRHVDVDEVSAYLQRWLLLNPQRARQSLRFLSSPLWRAYISTYVEGYVLLQRWLDADPDHRVERFGRLLDEPLVPRSLRTELGEVG